MGLGQPAPLCFGSKCPVKRRECRTPEYFLKMIGCCNKHEVKHKQQQQQMRFAEDSSVMLISLSIYLVPSPGRGTDHPIVRLTSTAIGIVRRRLFERHVFDCLTYCGTASSARFTDLVLVSCFTSRLSEATSATTCTRGHQSLLATRTTWMSRFSTSWWGMYSSTVHLEGSQNHAGMPLRHHSPTAP